MSSYIELNEPMPFGVYKGFTPLSLIKKGNMTAIEYLLDLRGHDPRVPRAKFSKFSADLHHTLDSIVRANPSKFAPSVKTRFAEPEFNLWKLEKKKEAIKRKEIAAEKAAKLEAFKANELAKNQMRLEKEELQRKQIEAERIAKIEAETRAAKERETFYDALWSAW